MTPTDVQGWINAAPILIVLVLAVFALAAVIETIPAAQRMADRIIDWILR